MHFSHWLDCLYFTLLWDVLYYGIMCDGFYFSQLQQSQETVHENQGGAEPTSSSCFGCWSRSLGLSLNFLIPEIGSIMYIHLISTPYSRIAGSLVGEKVYFTEFKKKKKILITSLYSILLCTVIIFLIGASRIKKERKYKRWCTVFVEVKMLFLSTKIA